MEKSLPCIPAKRYFTIGEVSDLCGVKPHVLRYWEQEFAQLRPMKRRGNRRYYQHHEVLMVRRIRDLLYDQGFTISGARNQLQDLAPSGASKSLAHGMLSDSDQSVLSGVPSNVLACSELTDLASLQGGADEQSAASPRLLFNELEMLRQELHEIRDLLSFAR